MLTVHRSEAKFTPRLEWRFQGGWYTFVGVSIMTGEVIECHIVPELYGPDHMCFIYINAYEEHDLRARKNTIEEAMECCEDIIVPLVKYPDQC